MNPVDEIKRALSKSGPLVDDKSEEIQRAFALAIENANGKTAPKFSVTLKVTIDLKSRKTKWGINGSSKIRAEDEAPFDDKDQIKMNLEGEE